VSISGLIQRLDAKINVYPDFPKEGISFKDVMPVFADPGLFSEVIEYFCEMSAIRESEVIVGIDARGFLLASAVALRSAKPLLFARKPGKLPGPILSRAYSLEYGDNELAMQENLISNYSSFAIIDDLLATGGTAKAVVEILSSIDKSVCGVCVLVELLALAGAERVGVAVDSILKY